jgi:hypothetical protein
MDTEFLDWALADFSGYVAADELYDGPFCVLSAVDNRCYKRILYDVLDHDPTHDDIRAFLGRLKTALAVRGLTLRGMTTDGSPLYPTFCMTSPNVHAVFPCQCSNATICRRRRAFSNEVIPSV